MGKRVALLRSINVAGQRKVPMADLRALATELGFGDPRTLIASGNLIFESEEEAPALELALEEALHRRFGFSVDVMVRTDRQWAEHCRANPFPNESERAPKFVHLFVGKQGAEDGVVDRLRARSAPEEKVARTGEAWWIYFAQGAGRSKLGSGPRPGLWTGRNWLTVLKIWDMLSE
jgi:uncharacterized protein (DUF1697 family)